MVCFKMKVGIIQDWCWFHTPNGRVGGSVGVSNIGLFQLVSFKIGVALTRRTVGSADQRV